MSDALLGPAGEGEDLVTLVDHSVVVILLGTQPGRQLEVVAGLQSVDAEVTLDQLRGDGHGGPELGEAVDELLGDVGEGDEGGAGEGDDGHCGVSSGT